MSNAPLAALDLTTIMAAVLIITTPLKALLELFVAPDARAHDALVQLLALCVGIAWSFLIVWAQGGMARSAQLELITSVLLGIGGGTAGIGAYHVSKTVTPAQGTGGSKDQGTGPAPGG